MNLDKSANGWVKPKSIIPDYETVKPDTWYAITINPSDKYQFYKDMHREALCFKALSEILLFSMSTKYIMYPELSSKGRFHWHGTIRWKSRVDITHFYMNLLHTLLLRATVVIKPITDELEWLKYCKKQNSFHEILTECNMMNIPTKRE